MNAPSSIQLPASCEQLYNSQQIQQALDTLAGRLNHVLAGQQVVALCVMNGGLIFSGQLLPRLNFDTLIDYCHATRYRNTTRGHDLQWLSHPRQQLISRTVLILDDIFDQGITLKAIRDYCLQQKAEAVISAVLLEKRHSRREPDISVDYAALQVEDRYVFGFGMDYEGRYRNLDSIYALGDNS